MKRISSKIILSIATCSIVIAVLVGGFSIFQSRTLVNGLIEDKLLYLSQSTAGDVDEYILKIESAVKGLATTVSTTLDKEKIAYNTFYATQFREMMVPVLARFAGMSDDAISTYLYIEPEMMGGQVYKLIYTKDQDQAGEDGVDGHTSATTDLQPPTSSSEADAVSAASSTEGSQEENLQQNSGTGSNMEWYYEAVLYPEGIWSKPYLDEVTGQMVFSYKLPILIDGTRVGLVGMDISSNSFIKTINDIKLYQTGYAFLLNQDYDFFVHPRFGLNENLATVDNGSLEFMIDKLGAKEDGIFTYELEGQEKIMGFSRLTNGYILGVSVNRGEALQSLTGLSRFLAFLVIAGVVMAVVVAWYLGRRLAQPVVEATNYAREVASGNLKVKPLQVNSNDEIGQLVAAFNKMVKDLRQMLGKVQDAAVKTSTASQEMNASSQETAATVNEVANAVEDFSQTTEELSEESQAMSDRAKKVNLLAQEGIERMKETQQEMAEILETSKKSIDTITGLDRASHEINNIVGIIASIAEQTNLLALNAAIEAARAGDNGRGFAVVADEVRSLAEETQNSATDIQKLISDLRQRTKQAVANITRNNSQIEEGSRTLNETGETFGQIAIVIKDVVQQIESVTAATEELAAGSQEISSATEEQKVSIEKITYSLQELAEMAEELKNMLAKFRV
ncbi:MAG: methyl-accepting chemotaxis protein [Halanaerobium sp.]|nr:methyl-accepting chemotaxis protein [Halanaerobium sp.]